MRKSKYQFFQEIYPSCFLHYNSINNTFLLLNKSFHESYLQTEDVHLLESNNIELYKLLLDNKFIIDDNFDECQYVLGLRKKMIENPSLYNVIVNTTLDCNLSCWYCYENKIRGSKLQPNVIEAIKKNIILRYKETPFQTLKLGFFGGEPFMCFDGIRQLLDFARDFCIINNIELIADFTTNATLITQDYIEYLKQFRCHFQITLDGGKESHNRVKVDKLNNSNTYLKTIDTLRKINKFIENKWIAVRINFNNKTLRDIEEIIQDINFLDRTKTYVILKKVWQLKTEDINNEALKKAIQLFFDYNFLVDYYFMPKGCVCFAERRNQVLFNFDGRIFKCTTISEFNDSNSLGKLDINTGEISWDVHKTSTWFDEIQPLYCKECKWFPSCLGICNRQIMAHKGENICTFDANNLSEKEYLMYLFKYNILKNELKK